MAPLSKLILGAAASAALAHQQADPGFDLRVTSVTPTSRTCFDTKVQVKGTYFLGGPAKFEGDGWKFQGIFDGFAMTNRFELNPQDQSTKMCYTSKWFNSGFYNEFAKDPSKPPRGVLFEDTVPPRKSCFLDMCDYNAPNDNNWVNMVVIGDELVWVSDTLTMVVMDPVTMNVTGHKTWADDKKGITGLPAPSWALKEHAPSGGSAHPLLIPGTQTFVEILTEMPLVLGNYFVDVYTFEAGVKNGTRTKLASIEANKLQYFHSFGVTPKHIVLPFDICDGGLGPGHKAVISGKFKGNWQGVHVIDYKGAVQVFDDVTPFFHVHIANTFENATGVTMDFPSTTGIPFNRHAVMDIEASKNKTGRDISQPRGQMRRMHFNLETKKTTVEKLTDNNKDYDFVKINPKYNGLPYCIYYCVEWYHDNVAYASMAVMKHDICKGTKTFWSEEAVYLNEPFFIANSENGAEDDGTLIFTANNGKTGKAIWVALDAKTFEEIERTELPQHLPFTAHGSFLPPKSAPIVV